VQSAQPGIQREELQALIDLLARYGAYLIADEIHADFVYAPEQFVPVLSLAQKNVLSLCAASKTFNLAGLEQAAMLVPDEAVRAKINTEMERAGVRSGNLFALEGTRAAYEYGDAWLDGLMRYLDGNRKHLTALVKQELPQAVLTPMEATYLGWLDLRGADGADAEAWRAVHGRHVLRRGRRRLPAREYWLSAPEHHRGYPPPERGAG
jgi:cystathionine beta-lyase